jgi:Tol biopolymer transport system component
VDTRLTLNSPDDASVGTWSETLFPAWFPSGDRLLHGTGKVEAFKLVARRADVAGSARELTSGVLGRISQDGRTLAFTIDDRGRRRLQEAPLLADGRLGPARPLLQDAQDVRDFDLSPDGRLVAYVVREANGRSDVFLADRSGNNEGVQVTEGGSRPRFARNGRELFFVKGSLDEAGRPIGQMMAATIAAGPTLTLSASVRLFDDAGQGAPDLSSYDVAPDGRFLMRKPIAPGPGEGTRMVLVQNWPAAVEK